MSVMPYTTSEGVEERARRTLGISDVSIYEMVARALDKCAHGEDVVVDVGCGAGQLWPFLRSRFSHYIGVDAVRYRDFPADAEFSQVNLDTNKASFPDEIADVVASVETIEHLENPRSLMRELVRLAKVGGWIVVTTPNQLSFLSLLTLFVKQRFASFQDVHYPAHLTALLEVDLIRMAAECRLTEVSIAYSYYGRVVGTPWHYPRFLARCFPRAFSDNILMIGRKAADQV